MKAAFWWISGAIALVLALAAPLILTRFSLAILTSGLIFAIFALSLNLILGHGGRPSLGHAAFFGIAAYTVGLMSHHGINNAVFCALAGIALSVTAALVIGPLVLRTRDIYFLMVTLAIGEVLRNLAISWRSLTFGDDGISAINVGSVAGIDFSDSRNFYFLTLVALVLVMTFVAILINAPFGHALRAIRDNRSRIAVLGVHPLSVEIVAIAISAGLAGLAGVLYAYQKTFVSPDLLSVETSAQVLLMVVVGGTGTLAGPVAGALVVEFIRGIGSLYTERWQIVLGVLAVLIALNSRQLLVGGILTVLRPRFWQPAPTAITAAAASALRSPPQPNRVAGEIQISRPNSADTRPDSKREGGEPLLTADNISKRFGGVTVLNGISLSVARGERRGLIGPNGAGKTTFLNIVSSIEVPTSGQLCYDGRDITALPSFSRAQLGIGRTFQIGNLFDDCTVRENILLALLAREGYALRIGRSLGRYAVLQIEAQKLLEKWNLSDIGDDKVRLLSYGRRRVIEIVLALATRPRLLLLDEPAAGLSGAETKMIIETISALDPQLSILIVEHDMDLIFSVCDRVTVIANGQVLAEGERDEVRRNQQVIDAYLGIPL